MLNTKQMLFRNLLFMLACLLSHRTVSVFFFPQPLIRMPLKFAAWLPPASLSSKTTLISFFASIVSPSSQLFTGTICRWLPVWPKSSSGAANSTPSTKIAPVFFFGVCKRQAFFYIVRTPVVAKSSYRAQSHPLSFVRRFLKKDGTRLWEERTLRQRRSLIVSPMTAMTSTSNTPILQRPYQCGRFTTV